MNKAQSVIEICKQRNLKIAVAESLTGGMVSSELISISGASAVFVQGIVSYTEEAKQRLLNVKESTLASFGAVSKQTAIEMLDGLKNSGADILVSTTGLAGPDGDGFCNEIGLTYIGISFLGKKKVYKMVFNGDRQQIRRSATEYAIQAVLNELVNK